VIRKKTQAEDEGPISKGVRKLHLTKFMEVPKFERDLYKSFFANLQEKNTGLINAHIVVRLLTSILVDIHYIVMYIVVAMSTKVVKPDPPNPMINYRDYEYDKNKLLTVI
jgi:hypothetical protein